MLSHYNPGINTTSKLIVKGLQSKIDINRTFATSQWELTAAPISFGNLANDYICQFAEFNRYLYAGVGRYDVGAGGGEIWRTLDGDTWDNVMTGGFGYSSNRYIKTLISFNGYLYAGTGSSRAEIWRSQNGTTWTAVTTTGFGNSNNLMTLDFCKFHGFLYAGIQNGVSGMQIFRTMDGINWDTVITNGFGNIANVGSIYSQKIMVVFNGYLYIGTAKATNGCEVWRTLDGINFTKVTTDGFGDALNQKVVGLAPYYNYLYAAVMYNGASAIGTGTEVWRTANGSQQSEWEMVITKGFGLHPTYNVYPTGPWVCGDWLYVSNCVYSLDLATVYRTKVGSQMADWSIANVPGFGLAQEINTDVRAMIDFNGYTYIAPCTTGPDANGFRIYRLHSGVFTSTGMISASGLSLPAVKVDGGVISATGVDVSHISAQTIGSSGITSAGTLILTPAPVQAITAAYNTITLAGSLLTLNPDANYTLTSTPTIPDGATGQLLRIQVASGEANTVAVQSESILIGSNLILLSDTRTISASKPLELCFDGTYWTEIGQAIQISNTVNQELVSSISGRQIAAIIQSDIVSTGVDEGFNNLWEAIKITATSSANIGSFSVKVKSSATLTNPNGTITGYLYTDSAGSPGTLIDGLTSISYAALTTSYVEFLFNTADSIANGTSYWLVLKQSTAPTGGTISINSGSTGTNLHAYSTDGLAWTLESNKKCWNIVYGRSFYGVSGTSTSSYGVYGTSTSSVGVSGTSTSGYGVRGTSTSSYGVYGTSTSSYGVRGNSTSGVGVYGTSTSSYGVSGTSTSSYGVYGTSTSGVGVSGTSTSGYGVRGTSTSSIGVLGVSTSSHGVYGSSVDSYGVSGTSTSGVGVYAEIVPNSANTLTEVLRVARATTGTASAGIGGSVNFYVENGAGTSINAAIIGSILTDITAGVEVGDVVIHTKPSTGAAAETVRITGAGQLAVNNPAPNASAILSATSTTMGFLPPVMTSAQRVAIVTPAAGLMVYDTDLAKLCVFTTAWEQITSVLIV